MEARLQRTGARVGRGPASARWDLEVRAGLAGAVRVQTVVEEHGAGRQLVRYRRWPVCRQGVFALVGLCLVLGGAASLDRVRTAASIFGAGAVVTAVRVLLECAAATSVADDAFRQLRDDVLATPLATTGNTLHG
jgi:hypothetical protein